MNISDLDAKCGTGIALIYCTNLLALFGYVISKSKIVPFKKQRAPPPQKKIAVVKNCPRNI